ncbi:PepSY domain-containing protein [Bradyrhizobium sp. CB1650]|uniref:PepSY domain-containing protein n=1 Tax=Bradyrhizobium sp. CB1650 TaxID=3039153 RepID=UPI002434DD11|nr:PepSY domain-containing protein [Bradyrhizobium sp. CB1650]WGD56291.1 PepSY domain-containing protein [Bradyrhizobium sp. CB1650]
MKARTIRLWSVVHTWTSLVSTVFLLLLCVTGLPLVFHHEIDELLGYAPSPKLTRARRVRRPKASPTPRSPPIRAGCCNMSPGTRMSPGS